MKRRLSTMVTTLGRAASKYKREGKKLTKKQTATMGTTFWAGWIGGECGWHRKVRSISREHRKRGNHRGRKVWLKSGLKIRRGERGCRVAVRVELAGRITGDTAATAGARITLMARLATRKTQGIGASGGGSGGCRFRFFFWGKLGSKLFGLDNDTKSTGITHINDASFTQGIGEENIMMHAGIRRNRCRTTRVRRDIRLNRIMEKLNQLLATKANIREGARGETLSLTEALDNTYIFLHNCGRRVRAGGQTDQMEVLVNL